MKIFLFLLIIISTVTMAHSHKIAGLYDYVEYPGEFSGELSVKVEGRSANVEIDVVDLNSYNLCQVQVIWPIEENKSESKIRGFYFDSAFEIIFKNDEAYLTFLKGNEFSFCGLNVTVRRLYIKK